MKSTLVIAFCFFSYSVFSQSLKDSLFGHKLKVDTGKVISLKKEQKEISFPSEVEATFPGGDGEWKNYLDESLFFITGSAAKNKIQRTTYRVLIKFLIGEKGNLSVYDLKCDPPNTYIENKCKKMIENSPRWNPAYQNGRYVKSIRTQPLTLVIK